MKAAVPNLQGCKNHAMGAIHQALKLGLGTAEDSRASLRPNNEVGQESIFASLLSSTTLSVPGAS